jgi:hypothetical protein
MGGNMDASVGPWVGDRLTTWQVTFVVEEEPSGVTAPVGFVAGDVAWVVGVADGVAGADVQAANSITTSNKNWGHLFCIKIPVTKNDVPPEPDGKSDQEWFGESVVEPYQKADSRQ